jgi:hypothetical protein
MSAKEIADSVLRFLEIVVSWPVIILIVILVVRRQLPSLVATVVPQLAQRITEAPGLKFAAPSALQTPVVQAITAEGAAGSSAPAAIETKLLAKQYPEGMSEDYFLIHEAKTVYPETQDANGLYQVRVWLETEPESTIQECSRVVYRLHDTFPQKVIATEAAGKQFELWLNVYGEFTVIAYVERKHAGPLWVSRYLDLPGRPVA